MFKDICSAGCGIHDGHDAHKHRHAPSIDHDPPHGRSSDLCLNFDSAHPFSSDHDNVGQCELCKFYSKFDISIRHIQSNEGRLSVLLVFLIIFAGLQIWFYRIVRRVYDYLANVPQYQGPGFVPYGVRFNQWNVAFHIVFWWFMRAIVGTDKTILCLNILPNPSAACNVCAFLMMLCVLCCIYIVNCVYL